MKNMRNKLSQTKRSKTKQNRTKQDKLRRTKTEQNKMNKTKTKNKGNVYYLFGWHRFLALRLYHPLPVDFF